MSPGPPVMYFGEQIRALDESSYVVANCEFYEFARRDGSMDREFASARDAVACFMRAQVRDCMRGVPVV